MGASKHPPSREGEQSSEQWKSDDPDPDFAVPAAEWDFSGNPLEQESTEVFDADTFDDSSISAKAPPVPRSKMSQPLADPALGHAKPELNRALIPLVCGVTGVSYMVKGFLAGFVFGAGQGLLEGAQLGLVRSPGFARALAVSSFHSGTSMSAWLATYSATQCAAQLYRGKSDIVNTMAGGQLVMSRLEAHRGAADGSSHS